jgi:uncharacterized protein YjdB
VTQPLRPCAARSVFVFASALVSALVFLSGCGGGSSSAPGPPPPAAISVSVTPATAAVQTGQGQNFTAAVTNDSQNKGVTWALSGAGCTGSACGTLSGPSGMAITYTAPSSVPNPATVTLTPTSAADSTKSAAAMITVSTAALQSIAVTPGNPSIASGLTQQFAATGTFSDGSTKDLTSTVTWTSSSTTVATIAAAGGLAKGVAAGTSTIQATSQAASGPITGSTTLTVTVSGATLSSIAVTPANPSIAAGLTQQFTATGTFSDGSTQNLTSSVTWSSSNTTVATITAAGGLAKGVTIGTAMIQAVTGAITGSATLTISPAALVSIAVTPANPSIAIGLTQQFTASGTFSDGSTKDITSSVTWSSSNAAVATIAAGGLATSVATGQATIKAVSGTITGSTTLTAVALASIAVTPANPSIAVGLTQQFTATGTFTDGSTQNITNSVTWTTLNTTVTTISAAGLARGLVTGSATIQAASGSIKGTTTIIVSNAALSSIAVTPANPSIALGLTEQFTATGTFTDGSTQNLTNSVTWSSSNAAVATIAASGLATGVTGGPVTIQAVNGSVTGTTTLTVSSATLSSIAVTPANSSIGQGLTTQFTATGTYSDSTTHDLTSVATWSSLNTAIATIASGGLAKGVAIGAATIQAVFGSTTGATTLTVNAANAGAQGQWQTLPYTMPINPIHMALMHTGKVLVVAGSGNLPGGTPFEWALWDPQAGTITQQTVPWDMFCNGMVVLPDGKPFIFGGTVTYDPFVGAKNASIYDPATGAFADQPPMLHGRWYPTGTVLGDGRVMVFSGLDENSNTNTQVEIFTEGTGWSSAVAAGWTPPLYPRQHLLPNGKVFISGSQAMSRIFDPSTSTWTTSATTNFGSTRTYGSSVLLSLTPANSYKPQVMIMGGSNPGTPATATTEIIDLSAASPKWANGPSMSQPRIEMNATILPNGKVLATDGSTNDEDANSASLNADLYDPTTNTFSSAGANAFARLYHSQAMLLPDATVIVAGGNPRRGTYEPHMEIYAPAYLFNADGSTATRPTITSVPSAAISYNTQFQVASPDASSISSVVVVRAGAVTHAFDMDQRLVGMSFTVSGTTLTVTAPPNGNIAPPGYYLLFLLNNAGVPSIASFVQLH